MSESEAAGSTPAPPGAAAPWRDPAVWIATCGGIGRAGFAPGTLGAAAGVALSVAAGAAAAWLTARFPSAGTAATTVVESLLVGGLCLVGVPICSRAAALLGRGKDPGAIVFDELAAMAGTLLVVPPAARTAAVLVVGFALFRLFDIWKPFPCRRLERLPGGLGVMADDWAAAAYAAAVLALVRQQGWL